MRLCPYWYTIFVCLLQFTFWSSPRSLFIPIINLWRNDVWKVLPKTFQHDVIKHFIFPYFFKLQRLQCNVTWFSSTWRYKTFHFPVLFYRTFSNHKVWNTTLLAFLVHDVIKHFIFPYFFKPQRLKCNIICFSSTWGYKTFHFPVLLPRTFSNRNVWNTTLFSFLVHDVIKHFASNVVFQTLWFEKVREKSTGKWNVL
jgi:hypothetical protein